MTRDVDVLVIGAGPAGCAAAMVLAAAGRSVAVLERQRIPRYKTCGGGVVERALAALPCRRPTPADIPLLPVARLRVVEPGGDSIVVQRPRPILAMAMRADLDAYLAERAAEAGAEVLDGTEVREVRLGPDGVQCAGGGASWRARFLVGADGAESRVGRLVDRSRRHASRLGVALEGEIRRESASGGLGAEEAEARFDLAVLPGGYGWVFPKQGRLSAGVFSRQRRHHRLRPDYSAYVAARGLGPGAAFEERLSGHRIPVRPRRRAARGGVLLAGDAAGLADPLTGEGISFAVESGRRAARAILTAWEAPGQAASAYEDLLRPLRRDIRAAAVLAEILYCAPEASFRFFNRRPHLAEAVVDVFLGRRTYAELLGSALRRPWRLLDLGAGRPASRASGSPSSR